MLTSSGGYSAQVELYLVLQGQRHPLGQVGPDHCIVREPMDFPPSPAELVLVVDGNERHVPIFLPDGASRENCRIDYVQEPAAALTPDS